MIDCDSLHQLDQDQNLWDMQLPVVNRDYDYHCDCDCDCVNQDQNLRHMQLPVVNQHKEKDQADQGWHLKWF